MLLYLTPALILSKTKLRHLLYHFPHYPGTVSAQHGCLTYLLAICPTERVIAVA